MVEVVAGVRLNSGLQPGTGSGTGTAVPEPGAADRRRGGGCSGDAPAPSPRSLRRDAPHGRRFGAASPFSEREAGSSGVTLWGTAWMLPLPPKDPSCAHHPEDPPRPRCPNLWPRRAPTWRLGQDDDVAGEPNVAGGPALQRDGEAVEVVQHLHDGGEAQVLDAALAPLRQRQPQVLRGGARTRYPATGSLAGGDDGGTQGCLGWRGGGQTALASCAASPARGARPADGFFPPLGVGMRTPASAGAGRGQGERLLGWDGTGLAPTHVCAAPEGSPV